MHELLVTRFPQFQVLHRLFNEVLTLHRVDVEHGSMKPQYRGRLVTPEPSGFLEGYSHNLANLRALLDNIDPHHFRGARCWLENGAEDHQESSLPRPVRASNYHYLALVDGKVQLSKSIRLSISLREAESFHCKER